ncbi:MAG: lysophospholipid acyltransferase family protein [Planctomycetota bacterium]
MLVRLLVGGTSRGHVACDEDRPRVYYANHTSNLDAIVVWSALPIHCRSRCRFVAARDYWGRDPIRRWLSCRVFRAVLINRRRPCKGDYPLAPMLDCLEQGESIVIFPEGTRSADGDTGEFRPGLWHLAKRSEDVQFIPVWIENLSRVLPKGEFLPVPVLSAVTFGEPIHMQPNESREAFLHRTREALVTLRGNAA